MRHLLSISFSALACTVLLGACTKEKKEDPKPKTKTELLTAHRWQLVSATANAITPGAAVTTFDQYANVPACKRDDYWEFTLPNVSKVYEGPTRCDVNAPTSYTGTWSLTADEKEVRFENRGRPDMLAFPLIEVTETSLKIQSSILRNGIVYLVDETYKAL